MNVIFFEIPKKEYCFDINFVKICLLEVIRLLLYNFEYWHYNGKSYGPVSTLCWENLWIYPFILV